MTQEGLWEELPYHFYRGDHINCELQVTVDGQAIESNVLPVFRDGKTHRVAVVMG